MDGVLLDRRYSVSSLLSTNAQVRRFTGYHVGLGAPVRIVELRPRIQQRSARSKDALGYAATIARAAALRHPVLPRVRDCFCARSVCYVIEDALEDERPAAQPARRGEPDLRVALRDGLLLCDAVACVAHEVPELLACLLIASATLVYDAGGALHLTTWDYSRLLDGRGALDPGTPELRAPELLTCAAASPDERAHVYSIAALLAARLAGDADTSRPATTLRAATLPDPFRAVLAPALDADPRLRTPNVETLGRALGRVACATLPALQQVPAGVSVASQLPARSGRRERTTPQRAAASLPRTRQFHRSPPWAVLAALRHAGRVPGMLRSV
jgi:hypothetical protein